MSSRHFEAKSAEEPRQTLNAAAVGGWAAEVEAVEYHTFIIEADNKHDRAPEKIPTRSWFNLVFPSFVQLPGRVAVLIFAFECATFAFTASQLPAFCRDARPSSPFQLSYFIYAPFFRFAVSL